jgi:hypothetical protein
MNTNENENAPYVGPIFTPLSVRVEGNCHAKTRASVWPTLSHIEPGRCDSVNFIPKRTLTRPKKNGTYTKNVSALRGAGE